MQNVTIALVEFQNSGNIGAVARSMKNFGFKNLILINPQCDHLNKEAKDRASHAKEILDNAKIIKQIKDINADYFVGTTAMLGSEYNIPRSPLKPEELKKVLPKNDIVLLIGRESSGLSNEEISLCDFVVTIPTSKEYPTLNAAHATTILLYEISKSATNKIGDQIRVAEKKDKEIALELANKSLDQLKFATEEKKNTQKLLWKKIIGKAFLTKREIFALCGFFKKIIALKK